MADVLIRGMEMPKHCGECGIEWCNRWKKLIVAGMPCAKSRPSDCPLIPVPDHGRLVDADFAIENRNKDYNWCYDLCDLPDYLNGLPTVIPAEPPKEET